MTRPPASLRSILSLCVSFVNISKHPPTFFILLSIPWSYASSPPKWAFHFYPPLNPGDPLFSIPFTSFLFLFLPWLLPTCLWTYPDPFVLKTLSLFTSFVAQMKAAFPAAFPAHRPLIHCQSSKNIITQVLPVFPHHWIAPGLHDLLLPTQAFSGKNCS